jgi:hypothetical protein
VTPGGGDAAAARLLALAGGVRGVVDGALPSVVLVLTNAVVGEHAPRAQALRIAIVAAAATGLAGLAVRVLRGEPVRQSAVGLAGLAVAAAFALQSGQSRGFFLPGMVVDGAYAVAFLGSVAARRPLVGTVHGWVCAPVPRWWEDPRLRRAFDVATLGWAVVYALRAGVQAVFYRADAPALLATSKLALGWPLTVLGVAATLAWLRRTVPGPRPAAT